MSNRRSTPNATNFDLDSLVSSALHCLTRGWPGDSKLHAEDTETTAQTEQPKNEVELKLEEYKKQGAPVLAACIQDCGEVTNGDVETGRALELPKPPYPRVARMAHAEGTVVVQVIIDLDGTVMAAAAVSGHPLLQATSVAAARQARFTPTKLDGKPVRVTGVLHYNFVSQ